MSKHFALIEDGVVASVILADTWPDGVDVTDIVPRPAPGWLYDGQAFTRPEPVAPVPQTTPRMTHYAFLRRLSLAEHVAIESAMSGDVTLRVAQQRFNAAQNVNVGIPETQQFVGYLAQQGLIAPGRVADLLAPIDATDEGAVV